MVDRKAGTVPVSCSCHEQDCHGMLVVMPGAACIAYADCLHCLHGLLSDMQQAPGGDDDSIAVRINKVKSEVINAGLYHEQQQQHVPNKLHFVHMQVYKQTGC